MGLTSSIQESYQNLVDIYNRYTSRIARMKSLAQKDGARYDAGLKSAVNKAISESTGYISKITEMITKAKEYIQQGFSDYEDFGSAQGVLVGIGVVAGGAAALIYTIDTIDNRNAETELKQQEFARVNKITNAVTGGQMTPAQGQALIASGKQAQSSGPTIGLKLETSPWLYLGLGAAVLLIIRNRNK